MSGIGHGPYGISLWKLIRKGWEKFQGYIKFEVGNGNCIRFWEDHWCGDHPLGEMFPMVYRVVRQKDVLVAEYLSWHNGAPQWDLCLIRNLHDWEVAPFQTFMGFQYSQQVHRNQADWMCWSLARSGCFVVKSYYKILSSSQSQAFQWKPMWKAKVPPRVAFFV